MDGLLDPDLLQGYAIVDREADFENALQNGGKVLPGGVISVKSNRNKADKGQKGEKKRSKNDPSKSSKKRKTWPAEGEAAMPYFLMYRVLSLLLVGGQLVEQLQYIFDGKVTTTQPALPWVGLQFWLCDKKAFWSINLVALVD